MLRAASEGVATVARMPALRLIVGLTAAQTFVDGLFAVMLVSIALELLDVGSDGFGLLNSALGVGGLIGAGVAAGLVGRRLSGAFARRVPAVGAADRR